MRLDLEALLHVPNSSILWTITVLKDRMTLIRTSMSRPLPNNALQRTRPLWRQTA